MQQLVRLPYLVNYSKKKKKKKKKHHVLQLMAYMSYILQVCMQYKLTAGKELTISMASKHNRK